MIDWDAAVLAPLAGVFAEAWTYRPRRQAPIAIQGVFDAAYTEVAPVGDGIPMNSVGPVLGVRAALFAQPPCQGDKLTRNSNGANYVIRDVRPDSHGHVLLLLNSADS